MRWSVIPLLSVTLALPLIGEENDRNALRSNLINSLQQLQQLNGSLISAALRAEVALDPKLTERLATTQGELAKQIAVLKDAQGDLAAAQRLSETTGPLYTAMNSLVGQLQEYAGLVSRFPHADDTPQMRDYRLLLRERNAAFVASAIAGEEVKAEAGAVNLRRRRLEFALSLLEGERNAHENHSHLDPAQPPLSTFIAWCRRVNGEILAELAQPAADNPQDEEVRVGRGHEFVNGRQRLEYAWLGQLDVEERMRAVQQTEPGNAGPVLDALRAYLAKQVELTRERVRLLDAPGAQDEAAQKQLERIDHELEQLTNVQGQVENGAALQAQFATTRSNIAEIIAKCPEKLRKEMGTRLDQLARDQDKAFAQQLKSLADGDRIDAADAEGDLQLVAIRLELLQEEAGHEGELAGNEASWRSQENNPALRELGKRYQDARERLGKARSKQTKAKIAVQQVRNRIALLQIKEELSNGQINEADELLSQAREELEQLNQALIQAAAEATNGRRAKDAKDADRIPLKAGADNF